MGTKRQRQTHALLLGFAALELINTSGVGFGRDECGLGGSQGWGHRGKLLHWAAGLQRLRPVIGRGPMSRSRPGAAARGGLLSGQPVWCNRGLGISAASLCMNSNGLITRCVVPSRHGALSLGSI